MAKNALYTKESNRAQILRLLRQTPQSRAQLARQTGLTRAAISLIVDELIREGMVRESAAQVDDHSRGRMPVLLKLCAEGAYSVGIRLSRSRCRVGICDFTGRVLCHTVLPLPATPKALCDPLARCVETLIREQGICRSRILGVGISAPGPVDPEQGVILNPPGFDAFHHFAVCRALQAALGLPVYLQKDANAAAVRHYMDDGSAHRDNMVVLMVDSGVGSGVIFRGKLLQGCELGHTAIDYRGRPCPCGNRGCLEQYAAIPRVLEQFPQAADWPSLMASPQGREALQLEAEYLSGAILNLISLLPVDAVLLYGDLQPYCHLLAPLITQSLRGRGLATTPQIRAAIQNEDSPIAEACAPVFGRYLHIC